MKNAQTLVKILAVALITSASLVSTAETKTTGFKLMMTPKFTGHPYFELGAKGAQDAANELGDTLVYSGPVNPDTSLQVETLTNFVTQRPDAIILAAIDPNAVAPILKQARKKGILVTTYDADAAVAARDMFVMPLSHEAAARAMLDCALLDAPEGGEIAFISASPTSPNHTAHVKFMTELTKTEAKYKVFKVVDTQYAADDDAKSFEVATNLMQAHPKLKVIISSSAVSAATAARAIVAGGRQGQVFATGFALPSAIRSYLMDGSAKAFAFWDPQELGYLAVYATHLKLAGKLVIKPGVSFKAGKAGTFTFGKDGEINYGKALLFTKETVDKYKF